VSSASSSSSSSSSFRLIIGGVVVIAVGVAIVDVVVDVGVLVVNLVNVIGFVAWLGAVVFGAGGFCFGKHHIQTHLNKCARLCALLFVIPIASYSTMLANH
jgi:hypothetical protein